MTPARRPHKKQRDVPRATAGSKDHGFDPAATVPPLSKEQFDHLCDVGKRWEQVVGEHAEWCAALPVEADLEATPHHDGRFTHVQFASGDDPEEVQATVSASEPESVGGRFGYRLRRALVGPPLRSAAVAGERMRKLVALPVMSSDALSSVAYGPQAMLVVLVLAGSAGLSHQIPIAMAIGVLMIAVGLSYRQTIRAYPHGGGSYTVASDNLGELPGLFAAAGLMTDYVLTVAVSVASGVAAVTSAIPSLSSATVVIGLGAIVVLVAGNLRGAREAGVLFAAPTYLFIAAIYLIVIVGLVDSASHGFSAPRPPAIHATEVVTVLLILRAFASGSTAMTGIEAISNAVPAFKDVAWRNARASLSWMVFLLVTMFAGVVAVTKLDGIAPVGNQTVLSEIAHRAVGSSVLYGFVQASTAAVLLLAANTAFNGFPRLLYFMAKNHHAPSAFLRMGDRLAFSNGIVLLAVTAGAVYVGFSGNTDSLIPLYAVGVFLAFTLSQLGMVVRWLRTRKAGWRTSIIFNGVGCVLSAIVFLISGATKFTEGAWVVVIAVPGLVLLTHSIRRYYDHVGKAVALGDAGDDAPSEPLDAQAMVPRRGAGGGREREQSPDQLHHFSVVPIAALDRPSMRALAYAASLGTPVLALHISPNDEEAKRFESYWEAWGNHVPLQVVVSPYRALVVPLARYIEALHRQRGDVTVTVVLAELIPRHLFQRVLHAGIAGRLRRALRNEPRIVVASVPFHLP
jgi:amino acid transporter